jgi:hypothetical protein
MGRGTDADEEASLTSQLAGGGEKRTVGSRARRWRRGRARVVGSSPSLSTAGWCASSPRWSGCGAAPPRRHRRVRGGHPRFPLLPHQHGHHRRPSRRSSSPSICRRSRANCSPELRREWRQQLGFAAEGIRVRPISAARAGTCTVLAGLSAGAREIFIRARPFTGSDSSHTRPIAREMATIIRVPELYGLR